MSKIRSRCVCWFVSGHCIESCGVLPRMLSSTSDFWRSTPLQMFIQYIQVANYPMKSIVQCVQCYCHQMSLWCCESVIFCNLSGWLMYSVRWWGRRRCNFVCGTKGIAAKMHSTPRPPVSCNWHSCIRLRWMICTLLPYWCILIWMICTLLMHFLGGFRNCVTHAGRVWPSRQASHQVGRSTIYNLHGHTRGLLSNHGKR